MITEVLTQHALIRMAQHGIKIEDAELIMMIGTEVEDGQFVRTKDCQTFEHAVKQLIERVWRLNGKRVVLVGDRVVTAYHTSRPKSVSCYAMLISEWGWDELWRHRAR